MTSETPDTLDRAMARSGGLDTLLRDLADRAVHEIPGAVACSVTVRRADRLLTLAGSGGMPGGLHQRQYENGSGPRVDAAASGRERSAADLAPATRCPAYRTYGVPVGLRRS